MGSAETGGTEEDAAMSAEYSIDVLIEQSDRPWSDQTREVLPDVGPPVEPSSHAL